MLRRRSTGSWIRSTTVPINPSISSKILLSLVYFCLSRKYTFIILYLSFCRQPIVNLSNWQSYEIHQSFTVILFFMTKKDRILTDYPVFCNIFTFLFAKRLGHQLSNLPIHQAIAAPAARVNRETTVCTPGVKPALSKIGGTEPAIRPRIAK